MQMAIVQMEEKGLNAEQAQIEAFYASIFSYKSIAMKYNIFTLYLSF